MEKNQIERRKNLQPVGPDFFEKLWEESWTYIKTVVDVIREPVLILDKDLCIKAANEPFYKMFQVDPRDTENKLVYKLGNGQWDIPALRKLLEDILPKNIFFKGFEVSHTFPVIGHKVMILNARQIHFNTAESKNGNQSIILLAIEDVSEMMSVAETLASHVRQIETRLSDRTEKAEQSLEKLQDEIVKIKKQHKKELNQL